MIRRALGPYTHSQLLGHEHAGIRGVAAQLSWWWLPAALFLLAAALFTGPARASVDLRVEAAPVSAPIQVFATVTDANGAPVGGLVASNFTVMVDGATTSTSFTLPPNEDPNQKVSVVFVMDYSSSVQDVALDAMQVAVTTFINAMKVGDFAAIVKFNARNPLKASVVQPFTAIDDGGAGDSVLISAVMAPYDAFPGDQTNLLDAIDLGVNQFSAVTLPPGPKAVITITDGGENASQLVEGAVIDNAAANSIPLFTIGVGDIKNLSMLMRLGTQTGGDYFPAPSEDAIRAAYASISERLTNEYLLTFSSSITDCGQHTLQVSVTGQTPTSVAFVRCGAAPPPTPNPPSGGGDGGGGGGGAVGLGDVLVGLAALVARRRRPRWTVCS